MKKIDKDRHVKYAFLAGAILLTLIWGAVTFWGFSLNSDRSAALECLFTGLAFVGLLMTIYYQNRELGYQRRDLKLQYGEMKAQREELEKTAKQQARTAESLGATSRLDALGAMLRRAKDETKHMREGFHLGYTKAKAEAQSYEILIELEMINSLGGDSGSDLWKHFAAVRGTRMAESLSSIRDGFYDEKGDKTGHEHYAGQILLVACPAFFLISWICARTGERFSQQLNVATKSYLMILSAKLRPNTLYFDGNPKSTYEDSTVHTLIFSLDSLHSSVLQVISAIRIDVGLA